MRDTILRQDALSALEGQRLIEPREYGWDLGYECALGDSYELINEMPSQPDPQVTALVEAARFYMSQFGQALEANEIEYGPSQIEADERLRAAITVWEQSNG
jgi:hypothetical protein